MGGQIFSEILPYLEVNQGNQEEVEVIEEVVVPNVTGLSITEAEKILKDEGIQVELINETEDLDRKNVVVKAQTPQPGITLYKGNTIYLEY